MNFTSLNFLLLFPVACIVYYLIPYKWRWGYLLLVSYAFYLSWQPVFGLVLAGVTLVSFLAGLKIAQNREDIRKAKIWLTAGIVVTLLPLLVFKYYNFINDSIFEAFSSLGWNIRMPEMKLLMPLGISFFTFMAVGYMVDVYRGKIKSERNIALYALFISFFPQVTSGPIGRADQLIPQLKNPEPLQLDNVSAGLKMMLWGYLMKLCLADRLGIYVDAVFSNLEHHNGTTYLLTSFLYTIQIYGDFAGYSLIAIGAARIMGIRLMENFKRPYFATSTKDFWRRWHISLSTWMRDYVYIPLGGSRVKESRHLFNIFATMLVSGLWHGAAWTFVFWGALHGLSQVVQTLWNKNVTCIRMGKILKMLLCFLFVNIVWVFFRSPDFTTAFKVVTGIFTSVGRPFIDIPVFLNGLLTLAIVFIKDLYDEIKENRNSTTTGPASDSEWGGQKIWRRSVLNIFMIVATAMYVLLFGVLDGGQFIYFQF